MIYTPLGKLNIKIDSNNTNIENKLNIKVEVDELQNKFETLFEVDKRFKIQVYIKSVKDLNEEFYIDCKFKPIDNSIESGIYNGIDRGIESLEGGIYCSNKHRGVSKCIN